VTLGSRVAPVPHDPLLLAQVIETLAPALSQGRRLTARLVTGKQRAYFTSRNCEVVYVPYPIIGTGQSLRNVTCGLALQASPSKEALTALPLHDLNGSELAALSIVEGEVAMAWAIAHWPGLAGDLQLLLPTLTPRSLDEVDGKELVAAALRLNKTQKDIQVPDILGRLPIDERAKQSLLNRLRAGSRMPYSIRKTQPVRVLFAIPVGGSGGAKSKNIQPPPSDQDEPEIRVERKVGIPYNEWDIHRQCYRTDYVSVVESRVANDTGPVAPPSPEILRYFRLSPTKTWHKRLEDGTDLDIDAFVDQHCAQAAGEDTNGSVYMQLDKGERDVATAILLDGSSSLGTDGGAHLMLELACADALACALAHAHERHAVFVFTGNTRHHVDIKVLKDFDEPKAMLPGRTGITTAGYTRLGAPIRHLTRRLLAVPAERHILLSIGDGLPSDQGYEGHYAFGDVAKAVEEADNAGVLVYHIGVGRVLMDPLNETFGDKRSQRVTSIRDLPKILIQVHAGLCAL
jgi:nitric oxide reductase NorD protein